MYKGDKDYVSEILTALEQVRRAIVQLKNCSPSEFRLAIADFEFWQDRWEKIPFSPEILLQLDDVTLIQIEVLLGEITGAIKEVSQTLPDSFFIANGSRWTFSLN